nr:MAG TPA: hypothetical protein [Caudoviricetes sp.]
MQGKGVHKSIYTILEVCIYSVRCIVNGKDTKRRFQGKQSI